MNEPPLETLPYSQSRLSQETSGALWVRPWLIVAWVGVAVSCLGCDSVIMPRATGDRQTRAMIDRNTRNLLRLQVGMFQEYVDDIMGEPQRLEVYSWGTVWLYRTGMTNGARGRPETDLTPLVFDRQGVLLGWGRDFLSAHMKRYE